MKPLRFLVAAALVLLVPASVAAGTPAGAYQFNVIARPGDVIDGHSIYAFDTGATYVDINNHGEVVFVATVDGSEQWSILTQNRFVAGAGTVIDGVVPGFHNESEPAINDAGQVAYTGGLPDPNGIFGYSGGLFVDGRLVVRPGDVIGGLEIWSVDDGAKLNNHGDTVFAASHSPCEFPCGIYGGIFTPERVVSKAGDTLNGRKIGQTYRPRINDNGLIVFSTGFIDPEPTDDILQAGIMVSTDGLLIEPALFARIENTIIEPRTVISGYILTSVSSPLALTQDGTVFFSSYVGRAVGDSAIAGMALLTQHEALTELDRAPGFTPTTIGHAAMNDLGDYVYLLHSVGGSPVANALFVNDRRLIGTGDILDGRVIASVGTFMDINDRGDVAFTVAFERVEFEEEVGYVVVASIPEPTTVSLVAAAIVVALTVRALFRRRKHHGIFSQVVYVPAGKTQG